MMEWGVSHVHALSTAGGEQVEEERSCLCHAQQGGRLLQGRIAKVAVSKTSSPPPHRASFEQKRGWTGEPTLSAVEALRLSMLLEET